MKHLKLILSYTLLAFICSCGFVGEEPLESKELYISNQIGACDIDSDAFAKFLEEDIDSAILCLEQNFKDFNSNVESDNQELLNKGQISLFVEKYMSEQKDSIIKALDLLFKINMLILKDHPEYISASHFSQVSKLLLVTNRSAVKLKKIYDSLDRDNISKNELDAKRGELKETIDFFSRNIVDIINSVMGPSQELDLSSLIKDLKKMLKDDEQVTIDTDNIDDLLVLKTILVGGKKEVLTTDEVIDLLRNLPTLVMVVYDAYYAREEHYADGMLGLYRHYGKTIDQFKTIFKMRNAQEKLFDKEESFKIADYIADYDSEDDISKEKARGMVEAFFVLKTHAVSPDAQAVHVSDIDKLVFYAKMVLESTASFNEIQKIIDSEASTLKKRTQFSLIVSESQQQLLSIFDNRNLQMGPIDLDKIVKDLTVVVKKYKLDIDMQVIEDLLPLKKAIAGGKRSILQDTEVKRLLTQLNEIAMIGYDFAYSEKENYSDKNIGLFKNYSQLLTRFLGLFNGRPSAEQVFDINDAYKIANYLANSNEDDDLEVDGARSLVDAIFSLKKEVIGGKAEVLVSDLKYAVFYGQMLMEAAGPLIEIADLIAEDDNSSYDSKQEKRKKIVSMLNDGQAQLQTVLKNKSFSLPAFDLLALVTSIQPSMEKADLFDIDYELIKKLIPLKKVIMGGTKTDFNQDQLKVLIDKFPSLFLIAYDLGKYKAEDYSKDEDKFGFFIDTIRQAKSLIFSFSDERKELIYTINELVATVDYATDNEYNVSKFSDSIETLVVKFLKGSPNKLTVQDIRTLLNYAEEMAEGVYYNSLAFDYNTYLLNHTGIIDAANLRAFPIEKQKRLDTKRLNFLHREFGTLIEKLHFYRTKEGQQYYSHDIRRTKYGLNEASMARFGVKKLLEAYCTAGNNNPLTCGVNGDVLNLFLHDFKSLLVEYNFWSSNMKTFASNVLYLADLFQMQSNGDQHVGLDEGTEYVGLILTAVKMANEVTDGLIERCGNVTPGSIEEQEANPTIPLTCFRQNVLDVWLNELGYKNYLTAFARYNKESTPAVMQEYISYLEQFVHENKDEDFMRVRDITLFTGAIQNVESMLIRFDANRNNFLNPNEVDQAFGVYENLIVDLGGLDGSKRQYAKSAFLFMVKEMTFPTTSDVVKFHYNPFVSKEVSAHRLNVVSILYYFTTL